MKQQVPSIKGVSLCDRCFSALLIELKQHKSYIRRTYSGNETTWTRGQVIYLAQVFEIDLERFKKGHKEHVVTTDSTELDDPVDMPAQDILKSSETAEQFGKKFLALMEKRPDINKSILEVLKTKLNPTTTPNPTPAPIPTPAMISPLPQVFYPSPFSNIPITNLPSSIPIFTTNTISSTHNFNYNYHPGSGSNTIAALPPTIQAFRAPYLPTSAGNTVQVNINFNMPSTPHNTLATSALLSEINSAVMTSFHRHSNLISTSQIPTRVSVDYALNGSLIARCTDQQ